MAVPYTNGRSEKPSLSEKWSVCSGRKMYGERVPFSYGATPEATSSLVGLMTKHGPTTYAPAVSLYTSGGG